MRSPQKVTKCVAVLLLCGACSDTADYGGSFQEPESSYTDRGVAMRLDLFQYGTETGGIVRYFAVPETGQSPFLNGQEIACFWTSRAVVEGNQAITLTYRDDFDVTNFLNVRVDGDNVRVNKTVTPSSTCESELAEDCIYPELRGPEQRESVIFEFASD